MNQQPAVMIITGASSGIGEATARLFAREGYQLVLAARRFDRLQNLASEIRTLGSEAIPIETDVTKLGDIEILVQKTLESYGRIDLLFNNAGFGRLNWLEKLDPVADIEAQVQVNLLGVIQVARAVLPSMIERRSGHIINMVSIAGLVSTPTYSIYAATKFGVRGFTDALRREVGVFGVHVSGIYPGGVETEFSLHTGAQRKTGISTPQFLRLTSEGVAKAVLSLARRPRSKLILPWPMIPGVWLANLFPGLADKIMEWGYVRRARIKG